MCLTHTVRVAHEERCRDVEADDKAMLRWLRDVEVRSELGETEDIARRGCCKGGEEQDSGASLG